MSEFSIAKAHAQEMEQANSARNGIYDEMENLYWMRISEEDKVAKQGDNIKITRTPNARNDILGAKRLMIATDPVISVPYDINNPAAKNQSDKLEKFCKASLFSSGRIAGNPIHYDAVLSALLYGDVVIGINSTKDMLAHADNSNKAVKARLEEISKRTAFLFECYNPKSCYAERSTMGLTTFFRKVVTTVGYIEDNFGENGNAALLSKEDKQERGRSNSVTLCDYYDLKNRITWMEGYEKPIFELPHNKPFIPVAYAIAEGSSLFSKPEEQREPFLYTAWRSGIIHRQSLILTLLYSNLFAMGSNPMFVDYLVDPENPHPVDYSVQGGTIHYRVGESRDVMTKQIIDPAMMDAWRMADDLEQKSTIYRQTLGEGVGGNQPYSSLALMNQSGRLPLIGTQRMTGHAIGEALEIACKWAKDEGGKSVAQYDKMEAVIEPADIPDVIDINVKLEIELPQDRLQMANAANMLAQGDRPLVSKNWARENVLNIGQSTDMTREIWDETTAELFYQKMLFEKMAEIAQLKQMALQPQGLQASGMPGSTPQPPGGMLPPEMGMGGQPNLGTPPQPNVPPGPQPMPPVEPMPPLAPNLQPLNPNTLRGAG